MARSSVSASDAIAGMEAFGAVTAEDGYTRAFAERLVTAIRQEVTGCG